MRVTPLNEVVVELGDNWFCKIVSFMDNEGCRGYEVWDYLQKKGMWDDTMSSHGYKDEMESEFIDEVCDFGISKTIAKQLYDNAHLKMLQFG